MTKEEINKPVDYDKLKKLMLQSEPDSIWYDKQDKLWYADTSWLVGGFAGMAFEGKNINECLKKMHEYFLENINHDSFVGFSVTRSGYPNLDKVKSSLELEDA